MERLRYQYLTAVIDCYSRCIVGLEVNDALDTRIVIVAIQYNTKYSILIF